MHSTNVEFRCTALCALHLHTRLLCMVAQHCLASQIGPIPGDLITGYEHDKIVRTLQKCTVIIFIVKMYLRSVALCLEQLDDDMTSASSMPDR